MRRIAQDRVRATPIAIGKNMPAPAGGWDQSSPLARMPPENSPLLNNWVPRAGYVEIRRGSLNWAMGFAAPVQSLMTYPAAFDRLFAASGVGIYDITFQASIGAPLVTGLASVRFENAIFANSAGTFLLAVNGTDTPLKFDGTSWTTTAITGVSGPYTLNPINLDKVIAHKSRLFFGEMNTLHVWYLPVGAIAGTSQLLDLGSIFTKGGVLAGMGTWSLSSAYGVSTSDDMAVFVTSKGQVAIYQGIDPSDASNWSLIAVYNLGEPLGKRALFNYGSDLILLTTDGAIPLSQAQRYDRSEDEDIAVTALIKNAWATATRTYAGNLGWDALVYPAGQLAIFTVPIATLGASVQYVQNLQTGRWATFSGLNGLCWAIANQKVYYGGQTQVYQWDINASDDGVSITADLKTAFSYFDMEGVLKEFTMLRPLMKAPGNIAPAVEIDVDFGESVPTAVPTVVGTANAFWDNSAWDVGGWANPNALRYDWTTVTGVGYAGAARMQIVTSDPTGGNYLAIGDGTDLAIGDGFNLVTQNVSYLDQPVQIIGFDIEFQRGAPL